MCSAGLPFETALRGFLEAFRLPGESQKIERILTSFADQYWRQCGRTSPFRQASAPLSVKPSALCWRACGAVMLLQVRKLQLT